jgi:hypothetical protein
MFVKEMEMSTRNLLITILGGFLALVTFLPVAKASEFNQQTKVTFDRAVEIPGKVLPAGTYWFILVDNDTDRSLVRIFSEDWKTLYATESTADTERMEPADDTMFEVVDRGSSQPNALVKWFYPGELSGHEFIYSRKVEKELAQDKQQTVVATPEGSTTTRQGS